MGGAQRYPSVTLVSNNLKLNTKDTKVRKEILWLCLCDFRVLRGEFLTYRIFNAKVAKNAKENKNICVYLCHLWLDFDEPQIAQMTQIKAEASWRPWRLGGGIQKVSMGIVQSV